MVGTASVAGVTLKVAEGRPQDAGRSLARLDPADMTRLSAAPGTIVQIEGKRTAAAKVMPAFRDLRGRQLVQIDGITRSNAGTVIGEKVTLTVVEPPAAQRVLLAPEGAHGLRPMGAEHVCRALADMPVVAGDRVRVTAFGSRFQEFRVLDTVPKGIVVMRPDTLVRLESPGAQPAAGRISYEDIGGLGTAIQRVRACLDSAWAATSSRWATSKSKKFFSTWRVIAVTGIPALARAMFSSARAIFTSWRTANSCVIGWVATTFTDV